MSRSSLIGLTFLTLCPLLVSASLNFDSDLIADLDLDEHDVQDLEEWVPDAENACNTTHSLSDSMIPAKWNPRVVTYFHHINCSQLNGTEEYVQKVPPAQFIGGVLLALFGSTGESLGFTLMKLAHDNAHLKAVSNSEPEKFYLYNGSWWMGFIVFFIGNIMDFAAFGLAGQAITILVGCWTLCVNLYTAPKILGEKRKLVDLIGAVIIMTGIGMAVAANPKKDRSWTTSQLVERYTDTVVIILLGVVSSLVFVTYAITRIYHSKYPLGALMSEEAKAKAQSERSGSDEKLVTPQIPYHIRVCHVLLAAMVGTITVCCAKAASEMLIATLSGNDKFTGWGMFIVAVFLISLPAQLHFVNVSLMVNDALFHIPVFYVFWQVGATITGGVLYEEFASYKTWQLILYGTGVLFLLLGIKVSSGRLAELETGMNAPPVIPAANTATITKTTTTTTTTKNTLTLEASEPHNVISCDITESNTAFRGSVNA